MALVPQRSNNHMIDSKACALVTMAFSDSWVLRDLTERDYGTDKIAERFRDGSATSEILMLQIKGTEAKIAPENPCFSLSTKTLLYAELFAVPFVLIYCAETEPNQCYYLWLQEYIRVRLNYENPQWRTQNTNTVYFPQKNKIGTAYAEEHLSYIAQFPKYQQSWVGYYLCLNELCDGMPTVFDWDMWDKEGLDALVVPVIKKLESGRTKFGNIPRRFIPDLFDETIKLGYEILTATSVPDHNKFIRFCGNCKIIQHSVENIALVFDASHLRLLYEIEGSADF